MSNKLILRQTEALTHAYRVLETIVMRTKQGCVFTIEVGENLLGNQGSAFGGKVTLQGNPARHIGFCEASSIQDVICAAEGLIAGAAVDPASMASPPKPHIKAAARVST